MSIHTVIIVFVDGDCDGCTWTMSERKKRTGQRSRIGRRLSDAKKKTKYGMKSCGNTRIEWETETRNDESKRETDT